MLCFITVGEGGLKLSGVVKQRVAIARILLKAPAAVLQLGFEKGRVQIQKGIFSVPQHAKKGIFKFATSV